MQTPPPPTIDADEDDGGGFFGWTSPLDSLFSEALDRLLEHPAPPDFVAWLRDALAGDHAGAAAELAEMAPGVEPRALATGLALQLLSQFPDPDRRFQARAVRVERNDACPCGSGDKHKRCCGRVSLPRLVEPEALWTILLTDHPELGAPAAESGALPVELARGIAENLADDGDQADAFNLLDAVLSQRAERLDEDDEEAIELWLELLPHGTEDGDELVERLAALTDRLPAKPRAVVYRHLAGFDAEAGLHREAAAKFEQARRLDPSHPGLGPLDAMLAAAAEDWEEARERADGWVTHYRVAGFPANEGPLPFLVSVAEDPLTTFAIGQRRGRDPRHERLLAWVRGLADRAVPSCALRDLPAAEVARLLDADTPPAGCTLAYGEEAGAALAGWRALLPAPAEDEEPRDPWQEPLATAWLDFLAATPAAADHPEILLDVLAAIDEAEVMADSFGTRLVALPVATRGEALLAGALVALDGRVLPWGHADNRGAVELLFARIQLLERLDRHEQAHAAFDALKAIAPDLPIDELHAHDHDHGDDFDGEEDEEDDFDDFEDEDELEDEDGGDSDGVSQTPSERGDSGA